MSVDDVLGEIRASLRAQVDPVYRAGVMNYFREPVDPYGVRTPAVRRIASAACRNTRDWRPAQRNRLATELWKSGRMEEGGIAILLYGPFAGACGRCEFKLFERWIDRYIRNWAHCDLLCGSLLAAALDNEPGLDGSLREWTASVNRWKRRAAAVALVRRARQGCGTDLIIDIAGRLLEDRDDMVQKGVGWLLKDAYPKAPRPVMAFLAEHKARAPRLVLRIAAEKMKPRDRARVMAR